MPTADELRDRILAAIPDADVAVQSEDDVHFSAQVKASAFAGKSRLEQHRMVYDVFGEELGGSIHALSLKTETP
ncbi:MAG: BolA family transcriptional regulator [Solirubrobacteraceae bacterium]|nr:BolA family transcriptional regulator [Solirubrobacteraceae bacterium]